MTSQPTDVVPANKLQMLVQTLADRLYAQSKHYETGEQFQFEIKKSEFDAVGIPNDFDDRFAFINQVTEFANFRPGTCGVMCTAELNWIVFVTA